jgi:hypothetical protein
MSRTVGAVTARLRFALAVLLGGAVALLMPSLFATTVDSPSAVVLAAVAAAVAAMFGPHSRVAASVARVLVPQPRAAEDTPAFLARRVADPVHHPLRPRAPGLV